MNAPAAGAALLAVTDAHTGLAHLVTDEAVAVGRFGLDQCGGLGVVDS